MNPKLVRLTDVATVPSAPGAVRRLLAWGDKLMLTENTFVAGADLPAHSHPHEQIAYCQSGEMVITVAGTPHTLLPGDSLLVPGGMPHSARAVVASVVLDVFAPPREEFK